MGGCHDHTGSIGEQHRHTVRRENAHGDPGSRRHQSIGPRIAALGERLGEGDDLRAVDLRQRVQRHVRARRKAERANRPAAILGNAAGVVSGAGPAVQGRVKAAGNAAAAGEESVAHAALRGKHVTREKVHARDHDTGTRTALAWRRAVITGIMAAAQTTHPTQEIRYADRHRPTHPRG